MTKNIEPEEDCIKRYIKSIKEDSMNCLAQFYDLPDKSKTITEYEMRLKNIEKGLTLCLENIDNLDSEITNFYQEQIDNITRRIKIEYYKPQKYREMVPKCDQCDENRWVKFPSPFTEKICTEPCPICNKSYIIYSTKTAYLCEFSFGCGKDTHFIIIPTYHIRNNNCYETVGYTVKIIKETDDIPTIDIHEDYNTEYMFESKKMCDEFCKRLNEYYNKTEKKE